MFQHGSYFASSQTVFSFSSRSFPLICVYFSPLGTWSLSQSGFLTLSWSIKHRLFRKTLISQELGKPNCTVGDGNIYRKNERVRGWFGGASRAGEKAGGRERFEEREQGRKGTRGGGGGGEDGRERNHVGAL